MRRLILYNTDIIGSDGRKIEMEPETVSLNNHLIYLLGFGVRIEVDANPICYGDTATFTSFVEPEGSYTYQWYCEDISKDPTIIVPIPGATEITYTTNNAIHNCSYYVVVYSNQYLSGLPSNKIPMIVTTPKVVSVSISKYPVGSVCDDSTITFTAIPTNGGSNPSYQWNLISSGGEYIVGNNSPVYSGNTFSDNDIVYCVMINTTDTCVMNPATSNSLIINITNPTVATLNIESSPLSSNGICTICTGDDVIFVGNVIPSHLSSTLFNYTWYVNNVPQINIIPNNNYFINNNLQNGDTIHCVMSSGFTSRLSCVTVSGMSNNIQMIVNQKIQTTVQITSIPSPSSEDDVYICQYSGVTFIATPSNSGLYTWYVNDIYQLNNSSNDNTYHTNTLLDMDEVKCVLSETGCTLDGTSNTMTVHLIQPTTPTVSIISNPKPPFCTTGGTITFTATTTGDNVTNYIWQKFVGLHWIDISGAPNSRFYTTGITYLSNLDIRCRTKTLSSCQVIQHANSNIIYVDVAGEHDPIISITSNPIPPFCSTGGTISFSAVTNETSPIYHWQKAIPIIPKTWVNIPDSTNLPYYVSQIVNLSGFTVRCAITGTSECLSTPYAYSNEIPILTDGPFLPEITIYADKTTICTGMTITFSASTINEGSTPKFNWFLEHFLQLPTLVETSYIYTGNTFQNNDTVYCILNSSLDCISNSAVTSNEISLTVNNNSYFSLITNVYPSTSVCYGTGITLSVSAAGGILGLKYQWRYLETDLIPPTWFNLPGETGTTFNTTALYNAIYDVVVTTPEGCIRISDQISIIVNDIVTPEIIIECSENPICVIVDTPIVLYSISYMINQGNNPTYQWSLNEQLIGTGSTVEYVPNDGDKIQCQLTSSNLCANPQYVLSNEITMSVIYATIPHVSIIPTELTYCITGQTFSFSATTNLDVQTYQWQKSIPDVSPPYWIDIVGSPNSMYYSGIVSNSFAYYNIRCKIITSGTCLTSIYAYSNICYVDILGNNPVSITISSKPTGTTCSGTTVFFTATPINGGDAPSYQWKVNNINVGTDDYYYQYIPVNGDVVSCVLTSDISCSTGNPATSNSLTMSVSANNIVTITIPHSGTTCSGSTILVESTITNGGTSPQFQWRIYNGGWQNIIGATDYLYEYIPNNGDLLDCIVTSNISCALNNPAISNSMLINVIPNEVASISILSKLDDETILGGSTITIPTSNTNVNFYIDQTVGACGSELYQWYKNGSILVGETNLIYSNNSWTDDNYINLVMTGDCSCVVGNPAVSNTITINIEASVNNFVIFVDDIRGICSGTTKHFTSNQVGYTSPTYQWKNGQTNIGTNSSTLDYSNWYVGLNLISCTISESGEPTIISNTIDIYVYENVNPVVNVVSNSTSPFCSQYIGYIIFSANINGNVLHPHFQWQRNNGDGYVNVGTDKNYYWPIQDGGDVIQNGNQIKVILSTNENCVTSPVTSNVFTVVVQQAATPSLYVVITPYGQISCGSLVTFIAYPGNGGTSPTYVWYKLSGNVSSTVGTGNIYSTTTLNNGDKIYCTMTSSLSCVTTPFATIEKNIDFIIYNPTPSMAIGLSHYPLTQPDQTTYLYVQTQDPIYFENTINDLYEWYQLDSDGNPTILLGTTSYNITWYGPFSPNPFGIQRYQCRLKSYHTCFYNTLPFYVWSNVVTLYTSFQTPFEIKVTLPHHSYSPADLFLTLPNGDITNNYLVGPPPGNTGSLIEFPMAANEGKNINRISSFYTGRYLCYFYSETYKPGVYSYFIEVFDNNANSIYSARTSTMFPVGEYHKWYEAFYITVYNDYTYDINDCVTHHRSGPPPYGSPYVWHDPELNEPIFYCFDLSVGNNITSFNWTFSIYGDSEFMSFSERINGIWGDFDKFSTTTQNPIVRFKYSMCGKYMLARLTLNAKQYNTGIYYFYIPVWD